ncbi:MAG: DUF5679 domain-containing protein [Nitrososphaeria archaeon]
MSAPKIFYCVKCREKKITSKYSITILNNKKRSRALLAQCPDCGTKMYKIVGRST